MAVNIITRERAKAIAKDYILNYNVETVFVTRDGHVYTSNFGFMRLHEQKNKLEPSWKFDKSDFSIDLPKKSFVDEESKGEEMEFDVRKAKDNELKEFCESQEFPFAEWGELKFPQLKKYVGKKIEQLKN